MLLPLSIGGIFSLGSSATIRRTSSLAAACLGTMAVLPDSKFGTSGVRLTHQPQLLLSSSVLVRSGDRRNNCPTGSAGYRD